MILKPLNKKYFGSHLSSKQKGVSYAYKHEWGFVLKA